MKRILLFFASIFTYAVIATNPHIENSRVNSESSTIKWVGSKISSSHEGYIKISKGFLSINHGSLVGGQFVIDMNSITCTDIKSEGKNKYFVEHLKDDDFFNVKEFPQSKIKIVKVTPVDGKENLYDIVASLTIKGITNPISFQSKISINGSSFLAEAKIIIDRTKWDIRYGSGTFFDNLGDKMILDEITFDVFLLSVKE
tara:strand:+ start:55 stop:654 length:600 start_codon:yes stop_codon:yes gene_type:complete